MAEVLIFVRLMAVVGYMAEGSGSRFQWFHWDSSMTYISGYNMILGSSQPLTEMRTRSVSFGVKLVVV